MNLTRTKKVPIVDATEPLTFKTRKADVKGAVALDPTRCVVARGIKRSLDGDIVGVKIGAKVARVHFGTHIKRYIVSAEARAMIKAYDSSGFYPTGVPVKLLPPSKSNRLGVRRDPGSKMTKTGKTNVMNPKKPWLRHIEQSPEW